MTTTVDLPEIYDGRWLRSMRTRGAIIDAWLDLIAYGELAPTAKGVALQAGIGLRTVFQHFTDMNSLQGAAMREYFAGLSPCVDDITVDLPCAVRVKRICDHRSAVHEQATPVRRACERQEWLSADIHETVQQWERLGSTDAVRLFAPELDAMEYDVCCVRGIAISAVLSWSTWDQLRVRRGLDIAQSRLVLVDTLTTLVS